MSARWSERDIHAERADDGCVHIRCSAGIDDDRRAVGVFFRIVNSERRLVCNVAAIGLRRAFGPEKDRGVVGRAIRDTPRDTEVIDVLKTLSGAGPLPPR